MNHEIDLSGLRDLHLLSEPSWWPLATGWWIILLCLIFLVVVVLIWSYKWRQKPSVYAIRKARKMTQQISDDKLYLKNLSQLLKRVSIAVYGRPRVASLSDYKWQEFLLNQAPETLSKDEAHLIAFAPYEKRIKKALQRDLLIQHIELWIKKVFKNKKSS